MLRPNVGGKGSMGGLWDVEPDRVPHTRLGRFSLRIRQGGRLIFVVCLAATMVAAAGMLMVYYVYNPEAEVRARTIRLLRDDPTAQRVLGVPMTDITPQHLGSRALQANHRWPFFGEHVIYMEMVVQGRYGRGHVYVEYNKNGKDWRPIYLHIDPPRRARVVLLDARDRV